jgi:hypothetical protein
MSTTKEILELLKSGQISLEEAQTKLSAATAETKKSVQYKVSQKGAISFYGIRKLPITLYINELNEIINIADTQEFKNFITENQSELSSKKTK